jgi:hypothetical protein
MGGLSKLPTGGFASMLSKPQGLIGVVSDQFKSKKKAKSLMNVRCAAPVINV